MGWLRAIFGGNSPEATRQVMKLALRQNLRRAANRLPLQARLDAASHALFNRYRARGYNKPLEIVAVEVLPFAFLSSSVLEDALAEYAVVGEHRGQGDLGWLVPQVLSGVTTCMSNIDPAYAPLKLQLFQVLTDSPQLVPWAAMLDEETLGDIWSGAKAAMEQLGLDTSEMEEDE